MLNNIPIIYIAKFIFNLNSQELSKKQNFTNKTPKSILKNTKNNAKNPTIMDSTRHIENPYQSYEQSKATYNESTLTTNLKSQLSKSNNAPTILTPSIPLSQPTLPPSSSRDAKKALSSLQLPPNLQHGEKTQRHLLLHRHRGQYISVLQTLQIPSLPAHSLRILSTFHT